MFLIHNMFGDYTIKFTTSPRGNELMVSKRILKNKKQSIKMATGLPWCLAELQKLTHWGRDKMATISQTTHSNAFSWIKMLEIRSIFHWSLFLRVESTILHHWFRLWLGADQATSHYLNQWWLDYRRIYASLGLNELTYRTKNNMTNISCTKFSNAFSFMKITLF